MNSIENLHILVFAHSFTGLKTSSLQSRIFKEYQNISKKKNVIVISEKIAKIPNQNIMTIKVSSNSLPILGRINRMISYTFAAIRYRKFYDIVFVRILEPESLVAALFAQKFLAKKLVIQLPGYPKTEREIRWKIDNPYVKKALKKADQVISASKYIVDQYNKSYSNCLDQTRINIIKPSADLLQFRSNNRDTAANIILYVSRINPVKRFELIIKAMPYVIKSVPDAKLRIIGPLQDRKYYNQLKDLVSKLNCEHCVEFIGPVDYERLEDYYVSSKIFVFAGKEEGQSNVVLEAMTCEKPVIAIPSGMIHETIKDGLNGFLIKNGNPIEFAEKITLLLRDEELRKKLGKGARDTILEKYNSWDDYVKEFVNVLHKC